MSLYIFYYATNPWMPEQFSVSVSRDEYKVLTSCTPLKEVSFYTQGLRQIHALVETLPYFIPPFFPNLYRSTWSFAQKSTKTVAVFVTSLPSLLTSKAFCDILLCFRGFVYLSCSTSFLILSRPRQSPLPLLNDGGNPLRVFSQAFWGSAEKWVALLPFTHITTNIRTVPFQLRHDSL